MKKISLILVLLLIASGPLAAQVGINNDSSAPDNSAMMDVKSTTKGMLVPRMTMADRNNIVSPASGLLIYQTDQTPGFYFFNGTAWTALAGSGGGSTGHFSGELYGGGVVFWVDQTGQHGLVCSMVDLSTAQAWSNITATLIGPTAQSDWDGQGNSTAIAGQPGHTNGAAKLCLDYVNDDYGTGIFTDWYLPCRGELNDLWNNLKAVQKALDSDGNASTTALVKNAYWSSTEYFATLAWYFMFSTGGPNTYGKSNVAYVRAVRAF